MVELETDLIPLHVVKLVKKKNTFKRNQKVNQIVQFIVADLKKNNNVIIKNDLGAIKRCCEIIENAVKKKDNIDKFDIVVKVFQIVCNYALDEIPLLKNIVQELLDSRAIKKVKNSYRFYNYCRQVIISNFFFDE